MKRFNLLALFILGCITFVSAQKITISEPEFTGSMIYVNDTIGYGIPLEKQACSMKTKAGASLYITGVGKVTVTSVVKGNKSSVRIAKRNNVQFIIKVKDNTIDPSTLINVFKLTEKKNSRMVELASSSTFQADKTMDINFLSFDGKKYGESSYLISIANIEQGEYAITLPERRDLFYMFGIE